MKNFQAFKSKLSSLNRQLCLDLGQNPLETENTVNNAEKKIIRGRARTSARASIALYYYPTRLQFNFFLITS